ncbi:MAG: four-carbon acid sugar kinase family protein [Planctomycetota bacterium]
MSDDLLLAYYGDDFTGSADVMEVFQWSGLRTVLFLDPPTPKQLSAFENLRGFGVAGCSRSMSPDEMDVELREKLTGLSDSPARFVHYKTCSTFDSSPEIGSIGKAIEVGLDVFGGDYVQVVIGAPNLGRYQAFGNLFARSGLDTQPFRLDRHPTMATHPITPMDEADVRVHLARQTSLPSMLHDVAMLHADVDVDASANTADAKILLFDVVSEDDLVKVGSRLDEKDSTASRFLVGSSGVEYALTRHWQETGLLANHRSHQPGHPTFSQTPQLLAITGSCSPVNDRQISAAIAAGFETVAIETPNLVDASDADREIGRVVDLTLDVLRGGGNVIVHSSRGPNDPRVASTTARLRESGMSETDVRLHSGRILGPRLGEILKRLLQDYPLPRVGIAGGDTSGHIARQLDLVALEAVAPLAPGSPLCKAHAENDLDGVEFFFKGGQVGKDDVWSTMLSGTDRQ